MGLSDGLKMHHFLVSLLSFPSSSLSLFTVVYQSLWLKITQFPKYNVNRLVSLEKEQKLSLRYGIETFSKLLARRDWVEIFRRLNMFWGDTHERNNWNQTFLVVQDHAYAFLFLRIA